MDEVVDQIVASTGLDADAVWSALGILLSYLRGEAPAKVEPLLDKLPGARELADRQGKIRGGIFGAFNAISGAGLGLGEMQTVAREFRAYAINVAGEQAVDDVLAAVPTLRQFI